MKFTPNEGRVLLKKLKTSQYLRVGNVLVPGQGVMDRELERGVIIVGNDKIKKDQIVWYSAYSVSHLHDEEEGSFLCIAEEDIMVFEKGKVTEEDITGPSSKVDKPPKNDKPEIHIPA